MNRILKSLLAGVGVVLPTIAMAEPVTVIHAGTLIADPTGTSRTEQTIIIRGQRIAEVRDGYIDPSSIPTEDGDELTFHDLSEMTVLPGLIDGHVHITSESNPAQRLQTVQMSDADWALQAAHYAEMTLMSGFTTVRDVGARGEDAIFALRDGIESGWIIGPRIFAAGRALSVTGGHGDGTQGYRDDIAELLHSDAVCDGVDDCRRAVREQVRRGADHIKLTATGGVLSNTATGTEQQFFDDELNAIMETAHLMGRKVTAHAHGKQGIEAAIKAGVDSIEHGTYLDTGTARMFKREGVYLVPTILAGVTVSEWAEDPDTYLTPFQRAKSAEVGPLMRGMAKTAVANNIPIAFGTDSGVSKHGDNAREFALLVEAGMTPMQAIASATVHGARNIGKEGDFGTIKAGLRADIIAVDEDPLADINALLDVDFVMKDGIVYKAE